MINNYGGFSPMIKIEFSFKDNTVYKIMSEIFEYKYLEGKNEDGLMVCMTPS